MESSPSPSQRLPVHQRRKRVAPENRKRVVRACNSCNLRRIKCSGENPCAQCRSSSRDCEYQAVEDKILISRTEYEELRARCAFLQQRLNEVAPEQAHRTEYQRRFRVIQRSDDDIGRASDVESNQPLKEGRVLQDPDGTIRYLGESSGAAFLDHLREFMSTMFPLVFKSAWPGLQNPETTFIASLGQYQTHDSRPLLISDVDPFTLPSRTEAAIMLADLRYLVQDGNGDFESGGIYYFGNMDLLLREYQGFSTSMASFEASSSLAMCNAAFALACQVSPTCSPRWENNFGESFFARARVLLGFYLIGMNRRDAAYIYVSVAIHISIVHGVHRGWMVDEQGKRIFWTLYILDRWLSCLMGRPAMIADEAVKIDLPQDTSETPAACGLRAHVELSRISDYIVSNIYDVARRNSESTRLTTHLDVSLEKLSNWLINIPPALQIQEDSMSYDRACCELHMAYNQLVILALRPILFVAVKKATADRYVNGHLDSETNSRNLYLAKCIDAARKNIRLCRWILQLGRSPQLLQADLHHLFNAAIVLELSQILSDGVHENDTADVAYATKLLEADTSANSDYARDCAKVLSDLGALTWRLRQESPLTLIQQSPSHLNSVVQANHDYSQSHTSPSMLSDSVIANNTQVSDPVLIANTGKVPEASLLQAQDRFDTSRSLRPSLTEYDELLSWLKDDGMHS